MNIKHGLSKYSKRVFYRKSTYMMYDISEQYAPDIAPFGF